jgi:hypothetical protein
MASLMDTSKSKDPILQNNGKYTLSAASFNLVLEERRAICTFLRGSKYRLGFR